MISQTYSTSSQYILEVEGKYPKLETEYKVSKQMCFNKTNSNQTPDIH